MSSDAVISIKIDALSKCYPIFNTPRDRLLQMLMRGRRKYYREFWALRDVSFEIKHGETVGIIGRNGSGKSTLLQIICGTLNQTSGVVQVNGRVAALLELGAGFNPEFTGRENVFLSASLYGLGHKETLTRFDQIANFAEIGDFIDQPVKTYSSGMFVRLAFAVIAHVDADILVIDEALAVGDAFFTQKCMRFLRKFQKTGTILFVSHDTAAVINLCERAVWLDKGSCRFQGSAKEAAERYHAALYESQQGESVLAPAVGQVAGVPRTGQPRDMRQDFINSTPYRNDIELFAFEPDASHFFGKGGAQIVSVEFLDEQGGLLSWVVGGENVQLQIFCVASVDIFSPIVGFYVKDRLGQPLFGDNTFNFTLHDPLRLTAGQRFTAIFEFRMPILPTGDYSVTVAIAEGTQQEHVQHHWIHDALIIKSHSSSASTGLIGIPMNNIRIFPL